MADLIVVGILVIVVGMALAYIIKAKKKGNHCIGCPSGGCCSQKDSRAGCGGCHKN